MGTFNLEMKCASGLPSTHLQTLKGKYATL